MTIFREHVVKRFTRSSKWPKLRKAHIKLFPKCAVCGKKKKLEVHHNMSFYLFPHLELNPNNLTTLCRRHHFHIGHLEYWKSYNPQIENTVLYFRILLEGRP